MMRLAERCLDLVASFGGGTVGAWWLAILIIGPLLGSFITEPGAMTISALLLVRQFYHYRPSPRLSYATIGLLFVNVSVGGTLTNFAAPPMVMAAGPWHWDMAFMFFHFGWKAFTGIAGSTLLYFFLFRKEFSALDKAYLETGRALTQGGGSHIPMWIIAVQAGFIVFIVRVAHYPALFIGGFLFFLAFAQATAHYQKKFDLRSPLLVGFFLAGLVVHGGLQSWWLDPVLKSSGWFPLHRRHDPDRLQRQCGDHLSGHPGARLHRCLQIRGGGRSRHRGWVDSDRQRAESGRSGHLATLLSRWRLPSPADGMRFFRADPDHGRRLHAFVASCGIHFNRRESVR